MKNKVLFRISLEIFNTSLTFRAFQKSRFQKDEKLHRATRLTSGRGYLPPSQSARHRVKRARNHRADAEVLSFRVIRTTTSIGQKLLFPRAPCVLSWRRYSCYCQVEITINLTYSKSAVLSLFFTSTHYLSWSDEDCRYACRFFMKNGHMIG